MHEWLWVCGMSSWVMGAEYGLGVREYVVHTQCGLGMRLRTHVMCRWGFSGWRPSQAEVHSKETLDTPTAQTSLLFCSECKYCGFV